MEVPQVEFAMTAGSPALGIFGGQQQGEVEVLFVVAMGEADQVAMMQKVFSLRRPVIHHDIACVPIPAFERRSQVIQPLPLVVPGDHHHLYGGYFAQTVDCPHQQLPAAKEGFVIAAVLVLNRVPLRPMPVRGIQVIVAANHQNLLHGQVGGLVQ